MENSDQSCGFVINVNSAGNQIAQTINNTYHGNVFMGNTGDAPMARNDRDIKEVIEELLRAKDDRDEYVFRNKKQWWAVYRVLNTFCNYPNKMTAFVTKMKDLGFGEIDDARVLTYDSLSAASKDVPQMARCTPSAWNTFVTTSENYRQQYVVADFLMQKMGIKS